MFKDLLKFELSLQIRQFGFWIAIFLMAVFGFLAASVDFIALSTEGGGKIKNNGAITLAGTISFISVLSIFFAAVFVVAGVMRDDNHKMLEIVHATPVTTPQMIFSRFFGAWLATFLCVFAMVVGTLFGEIAPWADKETFGPFNAMYYLQPTFIFVIINTLFVVGFYTAIAVLSRNKTLVYVSAVGLVVFYLMSSLAAADAPEILSSLIDPFGTTALANVVEFWPAAEQNTRLAPIMGHVGLNRLLWGGIGIALFALGYIFSTRGIVFRKTKKRKDDYIPTGEMNLAPVSPNLGLSFDLASFKKRFTFEYLTTIRSTAFMILVGIAVSLFAFILCIEIFFAPQKQLLISTRMAQLALGSLGLPMLIVMVFFGGEIMWRDRVAKFHHILDATPAKDWTFLAAKWFSLVAAIFTIIAAGLIASMGAQMALTRGEVPTVGMTYFRIGLFSFGMLFAFQTLLVMFLQNFAPNRIVGMLAGAGGLIFLTIILPMFPFFHPMMLFGAVTPGAYSEMSGFGGVLRASWFGLYWGACVLALGVFSVWIWRRGLQAGLLSRLKHFTKRITPVTGTIAALALATFIGSGVHIYKSYENGEFRNQKERELRRVAWEKLAKPIIEEKDPLPRIISVETEVDFFPSRQEGVVKGHYILENKTDQPVKRIFVYPPTGHEEDIRRLTLTGATHDMESDLAKKIAEYDPRIYKFDPPLAPGQTTRMDFETFYHAPRLGDGSIIRKNGTFVNNGSVMPSIGLSRNGFLRNPDTRRKYDLGEREKMAKRTDVEARQRNLFGGTADYVDFKARICTDAGQIPIAPGKLMGDERVGDDRYCRNYEAINPILNFFNFMSADYEVAEDVWENPDGDNVDLRIYFHKGHDYNIDLMMQAMKDSFDTYTTTYGPYQYAQLRVMEFPYASFAQAFAGTVPFSENIGFTMDPGDPENNETIDFATYVTMHEIGHQWFAHQVVPADTLGANFMSEGLTENASILAYRNVYGYQKMRRMVEKRSMEQYLVNRAFDSDDEPPLAKTEGKQYLDYQKASWVFWGLGYYIGDENLQGAMRRLVNDFGGKGPPYATTLEVVQYLKDAAGPDYHQLIDDYFERITFWDMKFGEEDIQIEAQGDTFKVTFPLYLDKKLASEEDGEETSVTEMDGETLNEWLEVGFYTEDPKDKFGDEWMALERIRVSERESTVSFIVPEKPTHILLDPRRLLIERNVADNITSPDTKLALAK
jgi:hypothetical protein